jgi:hypothetical protein
LHGSTTIDFGARSLSDLVEAFDWPAAGAGSPPPGVGGISDRAAVAQTSDAATSAQRGPALKKRPHQARIAATFHGIAMQL